MNPININTSAIMKRTAVRLTIDKESFHDEMIIKAGEAGSREQRKESRAAGNNGLIAAEARSGTAGGTNV